MDFVVLVLPVLDAAHIEGRPVREHQTVGCQPLVPRIEHGVKHGLVEEAVAHPLGDDDVHLVHSLGQADLRPVRPHPGDDIGFSYNFLLSPPSWALIISMAVF